MESIQKAQVYGHPIYYNRAQAHHVDIDLHINGVGFTLGERFDTQRLNSARCKKLGFLSRPR